MTVLAIGVHAVDPATRQAIAQLGDSVLCDPELHSQYVAAYERVHDGSAEGPVALAMLLEGLVAQSD